MEPCAPFAPRSWARRPEVQAEWPPSACPACPALQNSIPEQRSRHFPVPSPPTPPPRCLPLTPNRPTASHGTWTCPLTPSLTLGRTSPRVSSIPQGALPAPAQPGLGPCGCRPAPSAPRAQRPTPATHPCAPRASGAACSPGASRGQVPRTQRLAFCALKACQPQDALPGTLLSQHVPGGCRRRLCGPRGSARPDPHRSADPGRNFTLPAGRPRSGAEACQTDPLRRLTSRRAHLPSAYSPPGRAPRHCASRSSSACSGRR